MPMDALSLYLLHPRLLPSVSRVLPRLPRFPHSFLSPLLLPHLPASRGVRPFPQSSPPERHTVWKGQFRRVLDLELGGNDGFGAGE